LFSVRVLLPELVQSCCQAWMLACDADCLQTADCVATL